MNINFLLEGILLGLAIAAPVGPIGILCIKRSLSHGKLSGFFTGLGAATVDGIYGAIAAFGLAFVSSFLIGNIFWIQLMGIIFLGYLGIKTLFEEPTKKSNVVNTNSLLKDYLSSFILTITNPMTILSFIAIFTGIGLLNDGNYSSATLLTLGIFIGSLLWWVFLSSLIGTLGKRFNESALIWTNRISGIIILIFALFILKDLTNF